MESQKVESRKVIKLSICIVTLNAERVIQNCLDSIPSALGDFPFEIIIVDNASKDGTISLIQNHHLDIKLIQNKKNDGYTTPMNQALQWAKGDYLLQLNPDVVLSKGVLDGLINYAENNVKIGLCEPKVCHEDGSFQKSTRRGLARPWAVFTYLTGLNRLFPNDARFTEYQLNHLDENKIHQVHGISGTCMLTKRAVFDEIGYLDERFFAYQEDSDFCIRAEKAGWEIHYNPNFFVTHFTGQGGSDSVSFLANFEWHRSYYRYYRKHFSQDYFSGFNAFYYSLMMLKCVFSAIKLSIIKS